MPNYMVKSFLSCEAILTVSQLKSMQVMRITIHQVD